MNTTTYRVDVTHSDGWWMIAVPAIRDTFDGEPILTQTREYSDIASEARDLICTAADVAPSTFTLDIHVEVGGLDVAAEAERIARTRAAAKAAEAEAIEASTSVAKTLRAAGVPLRDIGNVIGVSFQRVSQLVNS
ncbi:HicB family toxin-antitoxin system [Gordonia iterans]|uniref:HicB family toxin-antitoxin system n=1 Tax=Gordonia iterans TaxID=1004901 RepID=A0A2S0KDM5_9ACTN|nr:HicB family toxin-antitoxin system [Gordonia iterans]AVL99778.1 HicB family toxin-antitoxin system [Gordonia iterans]